MSRLAGKFPLFFVDLRRFPAHFFRPIVYRLCRKIQTSFLRTIHQIFGLILFVFLFS